MRYKFFGHVLMNSEKRDFHAKWNYASVTDGVLICIWHACRKQRVEFHRWVSVESRIIKNTTCDNTEQGDRSIFTYYSVFSKRREKCELRSSLQAHVSFNDTRAFFLGKLFTKQIRGKENCIIVSNVCCACRATGCGPVFILGPHKTQNIFTPMKKMGLSPARPICLWRVGFATPRLSTLDPPSTRSENSRPRNYLSRSSIETQRRLFWICTSKVRVV